MLCRLHSVGVAYNLQKKRKEYFFYGPSLGRVRAVSHSRTYATPKFTPEAQMRAKATGVTWTTSGQTMNPAQPPLTSPKHTHKMPHPSWSKEGEWMEGSVRGAELTSTPPRSLTQQQF